MIAARIKSVESNRPRDPCIEVTRPQTENNDKFTPSLTHNCRKIIPPLQRWTRVSDAGTSSG